MSNKIIEQENLSEQILLEKGYKKYSGKDIDIFYNKDICTHSGNCVKGNGEVFEVGRRPWILPDNEAANEVARIIDICPSGGLKYILKGENK